MKAKTILVILMAVACVGASVAVGYAGGGGAGGPGGTVVLSCYPVKDGPNPPHVLEVDDQFINPTTEKVGKLRMICTFPSATLVGDNPPDVNVILDPDHFTCYDLPGTKAKARATVSYTDLFFGEAQTVKVDGPSEVICVPAHKECLTGCPGLTPP